VILFFLCLLIIALWKKAVFLSPLTAQDFFIRHGRLLLWLKGIGVDRGGVAGGSGFGGKDEGFAVPGSGSQFGQGQRHGQTLIKP
jgi:hypothetical protein